MRSIQLIIFLSLFLVLSYSETVQAIDYCSGLYSPGNDFQCGPHLEGEGNCTWYARYKRPEVDGICTGNASLWYSQADNGNLGVGNQPTKGSIAVFASWMVLDGVYQNAGHVAYIESVNMDNSFNVSEMGWNTWDGVHTDTYMTGDLDGIIGFIYPVGIYSDLTNNPSVLNAFLNAYNLFNGTLGWPNDNGGDVFVHEWPSSTDPRYRVWLQDFVDISGNNTALVLDEFSSTTKAYKIQHGFRAEYMTNDGPFTYGMPYTNEITHKYSNSPNIELLDVLLPSSTVNVTVQKFQRVYDDAGVLSPDINLVNGVMQDNSRRTLVWRDGIEAQRFPVGEFAVHAASCSGVCPKDGDQVYISINDGSSDPSEDMPWPLVNHPIANGSTGEWFIKPGNYIFYLHDLNGERNWSLPVTITEGNSQSIGEHTEPVEDPDIPVSEDFELTASQICTDIEGVAPWNCIIPESTFLATDVYVYHQITIENVYTSLTVRHEWYNPNGEKTTEFSHVTNDPSASGYPYWGWYKVWSNLDISTVAVYGQWRVEVYIDDVLFATKYFTISPLPSVEPPQYKVESFLANPSGVVQTLMLAFDNSNTEVDYYNVNVYSSSALALSGTTGDLLSNVPINRGDNFCQTIDPLLYLDPVTNRYKLTYPIIFFTISSVDYSGQSGDSVFGYKLIGNLTETDNDGTPFAQSVVNNDDMSELFGYAGSSAMHRSSDYCGDSNLFSILPFTILERCDYNQDGAIGGQDIFVSRVFYLNSGLGY